MELPAGKGGRAFLREPCACQGGEDLREQGGVGRKRELGRVQRACGDGDTAEGSKEQKCEQKIGVLNAADEMCVWLLHEWVQHCFSLDISRSFAWVRALLPHKDY